MFQRSTNITEIILMNDVLLVRNRDVDNIDYLILSQVFTESGDSYLNFFLFIFLLDCQRCIYGNIAQPRVYTDCRILCEWCQ